MRTTTFRAARCDIAQARWQLGGACSAARSKNRRSRTTGYFGHSWGLVGRATTVYECDLTDHPPMEQVVKLSWPEVSRTPEPEILKELGEIQMRRSRGISQLYLHLKCPR
jgi:hypothetical protein